MKMIARVILVVFWTMMASMSSAQGPLAPPGAPAPTMKTLQQVEPRTPISSLPFTINQPGSYYLTTNLSSAAGSGITIQTNGVTLDLMGFELVGLPGSAFGILVSGTRTNLLIRNGTVRNWGSSGISAPFAHDSEFRDLRLLANGSAGLSCGINSKVVHCKANDNGFVGILGDLVNGGAMVMYCTASGNQSDGISTGIRSTVMGCTTVSNQSRGISVNGRGLVRDSVAQFNGDIGISMGHGSAVIHCTARSNQVHGISASSGSTIRECVSEGNVLGGVTVGAGSSVNACTIINNGNNGILTGPGSTVEGNTAFNNGHSGILITLGSVARQNTVTSNASHGVRADGDCVIERNTCSYNGIGIFTTSSKNVIQGNVLTRNGVGIRAESFGSMIIQNMAVSSTSGTNYILAVNHKVGVIVLPSDSPAIAGNTGGSGVGTTDPWANFSF
jgi:parallel beta-helix repeat protein